jgi:putative addiction module component (TIGR02574 family)
MTKTARDLLKKALELSEGERVRIAKTLLKSVGDDDQHELSPEWRAELERRVADDDPKNWIPGDKFIAELKRAQRRDEARARSKKRRGE